MKEKKKRNKNRKGLKDCLLGIVIASWAYFFTFWINSFLTDSGLSILFMTSMMFTIVLIVIYPYKNMKENDL